MLRGVKRVQARMKTVLDCRCDGRIREIEERTIARVGNPKLGGYWCSDDVGP